MAALTKTHLRLWTGVIKTAWVSLRLSTIATGLLLSFLTGCGGGGEAGSDPNIMVTPGSLGATVSLAWNPVADPSVTAYNVYYGRQSPNQFGSCAYENIITVDSPSIIVTALDPETRYYFTVSAYNGLESPCSNEVSAVTPPSV